MLLSCSSIYTKIVVFAEFGYYFVCVCFMRPERKCIATEQHQMKRVVVRWKRSKWKIYWKTFRHRLVTSFLYRCASNPVTKVSWRRASTQTHTKPLSVNRMYKVLRRSRCMSHVNNSTKLPSFDSSSMHQANRTSPRDVIYFKFCRVTAAHSKQLGNIVSWSMRRNIQNGHY